MVPSLSPLQVTSVLDKAKSIKRFGVSTTTVTDLVHNVTISFTQNVYVLGDKPLNTFPDTNVVPFWLYP
ncbi:hypothetical protein D3C85_1432070 [compost metagenome]